ncbi:hypothetical protein G9A89_011156 [Geosiphon pyriformis]|nr:hypothetical protein G9A89_011156 [Geosiphon pyriformis]
MQIIVERGISFKSSGDTYGVPESSRSHAYLIETVITPDVAYTKVRSLLRKENILYLHQIQNKDGLLMTWMDYTRKYRQSNSGRIPKWFKILKSTIIMNKHRNINVTQCEAVRIYRIDNQIPDDLDTMQRDSANFGIAVDGTLSSTKTEAKAVLLALEAVPYKCKLILNTDSQAVLFKDSPLSIKNQLKTPNWHIWNAIKAMADRLAKEATAFDTVGWAYNAKDISYILFCRGVELNLNIRYFLTQQTGIQGTLDWISNDKVQETVESLDQRVDCKCTTKVWNWDDKMSSGFISASSSAMCTFIMKSFHNMLPIAEVLYNRHLLVYVNNLCKVCHTECLSKAVKGKHKILDPSERVVLSNEYIKSTPNIDLLCKGLINEQFGRINAFADIDQRVNDNVLIKWEKLMGFDNRVKRNPTQVTGIHKMPRDSNNGGGNSIIKMSDGFQCCNKIVIDVLGSKITLSNSVIPLCLSGYISM